MAIFAATLFVSLLQKSRITHGYCQLDHLADDGSSTYHQGNSHKASLWLMPMSEKSEHQLTGCCGTTNNHSRIKHFRINQLAISFVSCLIFYEKSTIDITLCFNCLQRRTAAFSWQLVIQKRVSLHVSCQLSTPFIRLSCQKFKADAVSATPTAVPEE